MRGPVGVGGADHLAGALVYLAGGHIAQGDALGYRAHGHAQVAAHAFVFLHLEMALAVLGGGDGLVRSVFTGRVAAATFDAQVLVDLRLGDIVEEGRDQIDLSFTKSVFKFFSLKIAVKDLLAQDVKFMQKTNNGDLLAESYNRGRNVSVGFSYDVK